VGTSLTELSDYSGDRIAHARDILKPLLDHQILERLGQHCHAFGRSKISLRPIWIAAIQHGAAAKLLEQAGYLGGIGYWHDQGV
jgi:hypothetical protein